MKARWKWGLFYCVIVCATILGTQLGSKVVSAMAEHKSATNQYCIVIDPGHGGEDGGAVSISNLPEMMIFPPSICANLSTVNSSSTPNVNFPLFPNGI